MNYFILAIVSLGIYLVLNAIRGVQVELEGSYAAFKRLQTPRKLHSLQTCGDWAKAHVEVQEYNLDTFVEEAREAGFIIRNK